MTPFDYVIVAGILILFIRVVWESELILEERKRAYRAGTHDYYGNPIERKEK